VLRLPAAAHLAADDAADGDVAAALALAPMLPVLQALEHWLGLGFESLHPVRDVPAVAEGALVLGLPLLGPTCGATGGATDGVADVVVDAGAHSVAAPASLALPRAWLPFGRQPPAALSLQWPRLACRATVQVLDAEAVDASALEPGAVLLLPQAFADEPRWTVTLQPGDAGLADAWPPLSLQGWTPQAGCHPAAVGRVRVVAGPPATAPRWRVDLAQAPSVCASAWFGAPAGVPGPAAPGQLWCGTWLCAEGEFLPVGRGWGLRLTAVHAVAEAAPGHHLHRQAVEPWT
jgi:hypothetical protein